MKTPCLLGKYVTTLSNYQRYARNDADEALHRILAFTTPLRQTPNPTTANPPSKSSRPHRLGRG